MTTITSIAGLQGSAFYALWAQQANENLTTATQPFAVRFSDKRKIFIPWTRSFDNRLRHLYPSIPLSLPGTGALCFSCQTGRSSATAASLGKHHGHFQPQRYNSRHPGQSQNTYRPFEAELRSTACGGKSRANVPGHPGKRSLCPLVTHPHFP